MRAVRVLLAAALPVLLLLACTAQRVVAVDPARGVTQITMIPGGWRVVVPGGIGRFRVTLPAGAHTVFELEYGNERPFTRLEGVQVVGHAGGDHPAVVTDGRGRVTVRADAAPVDLTLVVIDYYR
jgi:hypothetical protein